MSEPTPAARAILLVDDDETVQEFGAMALSALGHDVVVAPSGADCLREMRDRGAGVGLIVLDMLMPHMDGKTVIRELRGAGHDVPVLLCSGYDISEHEALAIGATAFLSKPYRLRELTDLARTLMAAD